MRRSRRGHALLGVLLGMALLTVTGASAAGAATSTTAAQTGPIKVGITIWSQPSISLGLRLVGVKAAIRAINKRGGINGHKMELVVCEGNDPNAGEACAHKMVSEGVVATIGDANLLAELPSTQILKAAGIAQIDPFVFSAQMLGQPNVFLLSGGSSVEYGTVPQYMNLEKLKTLHYISADFAGNADNKKAVQQAADYYKVKVNGSTNVPISAADYSTYAADAASAKADVNVPIIAPFMTNLLMQSAQQLGQPLNLGIQAGQFTTDQVKQWGGSGGALVGALMMETVPPLSAAKSFPELKRAQAEMNAEYKSGDAAAAPNKTTTMSYREWLAVQAFAKVAKGLPNVTAATVMKGFQTAKNLKLGLVPPWTPSAAGPAGFTRVSNPWMYLITVKNGQEVLYQKKPVDALTPWKKSSTNSTTTTTATK